MDRDPLFCTYDFSAAVRGAPAKLAQAIDRLDEAQLFQSDQDKLLGDLIDEHRINVPALDLGAVERSQREVDIDLSHDPREQFMRDLRGPYYVKATEVSFRVPFHGDKDVFYCRPSSFSLNPPYADIESEAVVVRVVRRDQNAEEFRKSFDSTIAQIKQALDQLRHDCVGLEDKLKNLAITQLAKRREKREKDRSLIDDLGFRKPSP